MALSPDDIERRIFAVTDSGYDTDEVRKFLFEVAAAVRFARYSTEPPLSLHSPPTGDATRWPARPAKPLVHDTVGFLEGRIEGRRRDAFPTQAGAPKPGENTVSGDAEQGEAPTAKLAGVTEVAEVLRAAHETVAALHNQAEAAAAEIREDARHDANEIRREAQDDAELERDRAKRLLNTAMAQATDIVADAESQAQAIMAAASENAQEQVRHILESARNHADEVLRIERETLAHLQSAHTDVGRAIESISRSENRPVVDLTRPVTTLRFGIPSDLSDEAMPTVGSHDGDSAANGLPDDTFAADALGRDPVVKLVRKAVERAVSAAAAGGQGVSPEGPQAPADQAEVTRDTATVVEDPATAREPGIDAPAHSTPR